jgi:trehalose 6-phosphate synthase/phosphatase
VELAKSAKKVIKTKQKVILGVDRLDYTKGLVNRLKAFEVLLERHPEHRGNVSFLQISVPSRTDVLEYQQLKEEMDQLVGKFVYYFTTQPTTFIFRSN